jgi:hypothetical protein
MSKKSNTPPSASPSASVAPIVALDKALDIGDIKTEKANELRSIQQSFKRKVLNTKKTITKASTISIDQTISEIESLIKSNKYLEHSSLKLSMKGRQIMTQLADLEQSLSSTGLDRDERASFMAMKSELERSLPAILDREVYAWFVTEMLKFKNELVPLRDKAGENESMTRKDEIDHSIRSRIAVLKGYEDVNMLRGDNIKNVDICSSIPKGVREILFHPVWLSRKLEREFTVIVEKSHDTHSKNDGCWIAGTVKDVDACVARLEAMDISGRRTLILDGKSIGSIMGVSGSNAYEIEQELGIVIYAPPGSVELTIFGSESTVSRALKKISTLIGFDPTQQLPVDGAASGSLSSGPNIVTERVSCNTCVARAIRNFAASSLEEKCGVTISINSDAENPRESWIVVRGLNEGVSNATQELGRVIKSKFAFETIEGPSRAAVDALLSPTTNVSKKGMSEVRLAIRFNELKKLGVFVQVPDHPETIDVCVADPKSMDQVVGELLEILDRVMYTTEYVDLDPHHCRCWTEGICGQVATKARSEAGGDVEIMCRRNLGEEGRFHLEIWGSLPGIEKAKKLVNEVHAPRIVTVPEETVKPMLENKCQVIQSIQEEAVVSVHFNRVELQVYLYGLNGSKKSAEKLFGKFFESVRDSLLQSTIKSIPIASDEIGRLIGPKGKTMISIKERSDLEDMRVSDEGKVFLTGTSSNIDHAISLIEEELSSRKDATVVQVGLGEDPETAAALEAAKAGGGMAAAAGSTGRRLVGADRTNDWVKQQSADSAAHSIAPPVVASEDLFPSLGGAIASRKKGK